jgi:hypothetical protein
MPNELTEKEKAKEEYRELIDEVKGTMTEGIFNARQEVLKTHWEVGKYIRKFADKEGHLGVTDLLKHLAVDTNISDRTLWYSVQFFDKFPTQEKFNNLPHGKSISWSKVVHELLPDNTDNKKKKEQDDFDEPIICKYCKGKKPVCETHPDLLKEVLEESDEYKEYIDIFYRGYDAIHKAKYKFSGVDCKAIKNIMKVMKKDEFTAVVEYLTARNKKGIDKKKDFALYGVVERLTPIKLYSERNFLLKKMNEGQPRKMEYSKTDIPNDDLI